MNGNSTMVNSTVAISFALFIVWMQRHGRWAAFFKAMEGKLELSSRQGATSGTSSGTSSGGLNSTQQAANKASGGHATSVPGVASGAGVL